jgi:uncharacterized membrane protein
MCAGILAFAVGSSFIYYPHKSIAKCVSWYCLAILCISAFMIVLGFNVNTYGLLIAAISLAIISWFIMISVLLFEDSATHL